MTLPQILIVDDQQNWRDVMSSVLIDAGYEVHTASSVSGAWKWLDTKSFDIAIIDVRLVDKDPYDVQGVELLEQMKQRLGRDFPIVVMTGYSFDGLKEHVETKYGVHSFIHKGAGVLQDAQAFRGLIASILERQVDSDMPLADGN